MPFPRGAKRPGGAAEGGAKGIEIGIHVGATRPKLSHFSHLHKLQHDPKFGLFGKLPLTMPFPRGAKRPGGAAEGGAKGIEIGIHVGAFSKRA